MSVSVSRIGDLANWEFLKYPLHFSVYTSSIGGPAVEELGLRCFLGAHGFRQGQA